MAWHQRSSWWRLPTLITGLAIPAIRKAVRISRRPDRIRHRLRSVPVRWAAGRTWGRLSVRGRIYFTWTVIAVWPIHQKLAVLRPGSVRVMLPLRNRIPTSCGSCSTANEVWWCSLGNPRWAFFHLGFSLMECLTVFEKVIVADVWGLTLCDKSENLEKKKTLKIHRIMADAWELTLGNGSEKY